MPNRLIAGLPWDGLGWTTNTDTQLDKLRQASARAWRSRFPPALRPALWLACRIGWAGAALARTRAFGKALGLEGGEMRALYRDCLRTGGDPIDAYVWRRLFGMRHPLPARSAALVCRMLGDPAGHALLADKVALGELLATHGLPTPSLRTLYPRGGTVGPELRREAARGAGLFLKPRHGSGGRGAFALSGDAKGAQIDGHDTPWPHAEERANRLLARDDLLAQERLTAANTLADLASGGRAPVLRLVTARAPGEAPWLHSALLVVARPGRNPANFLHGAVYAPIDRATGTVACGIVLDAPQRRLKQIEEGGPPLAERAVPDFDRAVAIALAAMAALPPLPVVHWDILPSPAGPVLLEGNSAGNWVLANLPGMLGLDAGPLASVLWAWRGEHP